MYLTASLPAIGLIALGAAVVLYWAFTRSARSEKKIRTQDVPDWWGSYLMDRLPHYEGLSPDDRREFLKCVLVFLTDQRITGIQCDPTDEDRLLIAGIAVLMAWGFDSFRYPNRSEILVYPSAFNLDYELDEEGERIGEMDAAGPIILSLPELREAFRADDWTNVCVHELAHVLDALMSPDPESFQSEFDPRLQALMSDRELVHLVESGQSLIDDYALEDRQEFFAVSSEVFFDDPELLLEMHPGVYDWMVDTYRQEPVQKP
jgi:Mlc titration factor MtfA (ptsG expression regulator)